MFTKNIWDTTLIIIEIDDKLKLVTEIFDNTKANRLLSCRVDKTRYIHLSLLYIRNETVDAL